MFFVSSRQLDAEPLSKGWRTPAQIDAGIEDAAAYNPHQFPLRMPDLIMHAAQNVAARKGMIVLYEREVTSDRFGKKFLIETLEQEPAVVFMDDGSKNKQSVQGSGVDVHMDNWSGRRDSNPRLQPWQGCALPLSYARNRGDLYRS